MGPVSVTNMEEEDWRPVRSFWHSIIAQHPACGHSRPMIR